MTRRQILSAAALGLAGSPFAVPQQYRGMASRGITPAPRGKPSGLPFHAKFANVASQAGLHAPVIYGNEGHLDYILHAMGCGVSFIDYDNDGWPNGKPERIAGVSANQLVVIREGSGIVRREIFSPAARVGQP